MSAETMPLEDALDRQLAALTPQQLAALRAEPVVGDRPALARNTTRRSRERFPLIRKLSRGFWHVVRRA